DCPTLWESMHAAGYFSAGFNKLMHMAPAAKFNWDFRNEGGKKNPEDGGRIPAAYHENTARAIQMAREKGVPFFINANIIDPHRPFYGTPKDKEIGGEKLANEFSE